MAAPTAAPATNASKIFVPLFSLMVQIKVGDGRPARNADPEPEFRLFREITGSVLLIKSKKLFFSFVRVTLLFLGVEMWVNPIGFSD